MTRVEIFIAVSMLFFLALIGTGIYRSGECKIYHLTVEEIGMCDQYKWCRVFLSDGTTTFADRPFIGQKIDICRKEKAK